MLCGVHILSLGTVARMRALKCPGSRWAVVLAGFSRSRRLVQDLDEDRGGELQLCDYYTTDPRACGSSIPRTGGGSWLVVRADRAKGGETALLVSLDHCSGGTRLNTKGARYIVNACLRSVSAFAVELGAALGAESLFRPHLAATLGADPLCTGSCPDLFQRLCCRCADEFVVAA
jgi:hypothetical protein